MSVLWEDPPVPAGAGKHASLFSSAEAELRANPGRWAVLKEYNTRQAAHGAAQYYKSRRPGFEFQASQGKLYARYVDNGAQVPYASDQGGNEHDEVQRLAPRGSGGERSEGDR